VTDLRTRARAWVVQDPDPRDRAEIEALISDEGDAARAELEDRFSGRLRFGTAGLRGRVGAGPNRMNRAVVRQTTAALVRWLDLHDPGARRSGVVVGCDARHRSAQLADETTAVLAGSGVPVRRLPDRVPTPLCAFAVRHFGAAAGVMITASHNPPQDNGYKLYLRDGAQVVPPVDREIEALVEEVGPLGDIPCADLPSPLVVDAGEEVADAYLRAVLVGTPDGSRPPRPLSVVYTPLHGVAGALFAEALRLGGYPPASVVAAQRDPDPDFPTVALPNPEEKGALDLALAQGRRLGADLVLAHDPDGDRLAAAVPDLTGAWRTLSGDELGTVLGAFVLEQVQAGRYPRRDTGATPLVAASIVSSSMLGRIAADAGVPFVATLTGFKWIARAADAVPGSRLVFGYEEALGYVVGDAVRDKDGIGAALALLSLAGELAARGSTLPGYLDALMRRYGVHRTAQRSVRAADPADKMARLRARPPREIGRIGVERTLDLREGAAWQDGMPCLPPADVLAFWLETGARVLVRPSGTEPKLKAYVEVVRPVADDDLGAASAASAAELERVTAALGPLLGS